ncbi:hypothetical protein [uncultured Finegoldia sp.]|uniref:DUF1659 domain-containing protein n=1 Tax=uncultured Finegoldia sp. TaxID=328009 RepID=UPI00261F7C71|nr:hypothetical protein [uncultured Finegoldia sp.]
MKQLKITSAVVKDGKQKKLSKTINNVNDKVAEDKLRDACLAIQELMLGKDKQAYLVETKQL